MGVFDYDSAKQYFDAEEKLQVDGICGTGGGYLRHRRGLSAPFETTTPLRAPGGANNKGLLPVQTFDQKNKIALKAGLLLPTLINDAEFIGGL